MKRIARGDIHLAPEGGAEFDPEIHQVEEAPPPLELDEEIHVAVRSCVAASDRAEDARVDDPMLSHGDFNLAPEGLEGRTHGSESRPGGRKLGNGDPQGRPMAVRVTLTDWF